MQSDWIIESFSRVIVTNAKMTGDWKTHYMRLDAKRFIFGQGSSGKIFLDLLSLPLYSVWQTNKGTSCKRKIRNKLTRYFLSDDENFSATPDESPDSTAIN